MNQGPSPFAGVERRQHAVFVTKNSEYHARRGQVVAVRQRGASDWARSHKALLMRVEGHVEPASGIPLPGPPGPGQRLFLARDEDESVTTSVVVAVERPPKETVAQYPADEAAHE
jgi:hypothetical protein